MPPDDTAGATRSAAECPREAYALHRELRAVYDTLDAHLAAARWDEAAALVPRRQAVEAALRPLAAVRQAVTTPAEVALWAAVDAIAAELAARQAAALRLAKAARDATATRLAGLHASRTNAARYQDETAPIPVFASRRA